MIREKNATIQAQQAEIQQLRDQLAVSEQVSWHTSLVCTPALLPFMVSNHGLQTECGSIRSCSVSKLSAHYAMYASYIK